MAYKNSDIYVTEPSEDELKNYIDYNQRFSVRPEYRLFIIGGVTTVYSIFDGFYRGFNDAALVYLAENSHRLPRTVGGWYFYHKRKNYVCIKNGLVQAGKFTLKLSGSVLLYFTLEAMLDEWRGKIDFLNTATATVVAATAYGKVKNFNPFQMKNIMKRSLILGIVSGLAQDGFIYANNGNLWYVNECKKFIQ